MSTKPILVIYYSIAGLSKEVIVKNLKHIKEIAKKIEEYYVFALPTQKDSRIEVFYEKDFDEVSFKELEEKVLKEIENL
jgi:hypothetical protein